MKKKRQPITSGFARAGVYARRSICAYLKMHCPPEKQTLTFVRELTAEDEEMLKKTQK